MKTPREFIIAKLFINKIEYPSVLIMNWRKSSGRWRDEDPNIDEDARALQ